MQRKIGIGGSDFKNLIENDFYFVDKSLLIKQVIEDTFEVILLPRPRRFGKTLNLSMLYYFFEKNDNANSELFKGLSIEKEDIFKKHFGKYPVIFLSFKDVKEKDFEQSVINIKNLISKEYGRHSYILKTDILSENQKKRIRFYSRKERGNRRLYLCIDKLIRISFQIS